MKTNEGSLDRILRVLGGILLIVLGLLGVMSGAWMWVAYIVGALLLVTGVVGFCPLYALLRTSTNKK